MADVGISFGGDSADARRAAEQIIRELEKVSRQAVQTAAVMRTALGGVSKDFGGMTKASVTNRKELERNRTEVDRNTNSFSKFSRQIIVANQALSLMGKAIAVLKFPAMIVAVGYAIQAVNALVAGALALVGALGQLAGLAGVIPGAILTLGTAALTAKLAFAGLKEALNGNAEAFKKLTPEAQEFVKTLNGIKTITKDLRQSAQRGLFPGLTEGLGQIFNQRNVAIFRSNLQLMGKAMGDTFAELGRLIGSSGFAADLDKLLKSAARNFRILGSAAVDIVDAFRNIAVAAQPLVNYVTSLISRFAAWIQKTTEAGRASGALARFFDQTKQTLQELGGILGPLGRALVNIFKIAAPYGHEILRLLGGAAENAQKFTESLSGQSKIKKYFADGMPALIEMARLVRDVAKAFLSMGATPELVNLIKRLRLELLPVLVGIMDSAMNGFAPALVDAAIALAKLVGVIAGASGPLTQFVKILGGIFTFLDWVIKNVPHATQLLTVMFGLMAVNKILPISKGIGALAKAYVGLGIAEAEAGVAATGWAAVTALALRTIKLALVSTGIGILLVAIGLAAELIMSHWDKIGPYFKALMTTITEIIKGAAYLWLNYLTYPVKAFLKVLSLIPDQIPFFGGVGDDATNALNAINGFIGKFKPNIDKVKKGWEDAGKATHGAKDEVDAYGVAVDSVATKAALANQAMTFSTVQGGAAGQVGIASPTGAPLTKTRQTILRAAYEKGPASGRVYAAVGAITDCSGYVMDVYAQAGIKLPHNADAMWRRNSSSTPGVIEEYNQPLQPGDAVFFVGGDGSATHPGHVGLVVGPGDRFAEYYTTGKQARYNNVSAKSGFVGSKRWLLPIEQTGGAPAETFSPSAIVPTEPPLKSTGTKTSSKAPTKKDIAAVRADVSVFARGTRRVLDPGIREELADDIKEVRKLLSGPVTRVEMDKAKKLFDQMKALYADGVNLNPIVQKLNYFDSHMGRFAGLPQTAAAIREGIKRTRALIKKFTQKGSEGGILVTDEEQKQIEDSFAKVGASVKKGLQRAAIQKQIRDFVASMKNVNIAAAVEKAMAPPPTADELRERIGELIRKARNALPGQVKGLLARAAELRQQLIDSLSLERSNAKQRVTDALQGIFDNAMDAITTKWQRWLKGQEAAIAAAFGVIRGQTAASRKLQAFRDAREEAQIKKAVVAANKELADSELELTNLRQQGADPETIKQSEERVQAARDAIAEQKLDAQDRTLQKEADAQEQAYQDALDAAREQADAMAEIERNKFAERYRMIQDAYAKETISAEEAQKQILSLLGEYGIDTTEAMGATAVFTKALDELGQAIIALARALRNAKDAAGAPEGGGNAPRDSGDATNAQNKITVANIIRGGGARGALTAAEGGVVSTGGTRIGRDHVLVAASQGEVILNAAQQANLIAGMSRGAPIIVQINRPLLLGRSLAVADEIAGAVAPAINRRIGYRY